MTDRNTIDQLILKGQLEEAVEKLDENIIEEPDNAVWWYLRGKTYWRMGERRHAMIDYEEAAHLDPSGPAIHALEMVNDILDYYNPDLLNP